MKAITSGMLKGWLLPMLFVCGVMTGQAQTVTTFPYYENFESTNGGYTFGGSQPWNWGTPAKTAINKAGEGTRCWVSGPLTQYVSLPLSGTYLQTRTFDFTNLKAPYISFKFIVELENNWMGVVFESSVNNGPWMMVGTYNEPNDACNTLNWYNDNRGAGISWSGAINASPCGGNTYTPGCGLIPLCGKWNTARHCVNNLAGQANVKFRWRFVRNASGYECDHEGFAIDSVVIAEGSSNATFNAPTACAGAPASFSTLVSGCSSNPRWDFGDGSSVIQALNPVKVYRNAGTYQVKLLTSGSCGKQDTFEKAVTVLPPPPINRQPGMLNDRYCASAAPVPLNGSRTPAGGTFFVNGNPAAVFDPVALGVGTHRVVYVYSEPSGNRCTARDTQIVNVYRPDVSIDSLGGSYCLSSPVVHLKGKPAGGTFTVNGNPADSFSAAHLGLGQHTIVYTYIDPAGCVGTDTKVIDVVSNIVAQITGLSASYCAYEQALALTGSPAGGRFTIDGTNAAILNPAALAAGTHRVIYTYSDGGSCGDADTFDFDIIDVQASIDLLDSVYCPDHAVVNLQGNPAGGSFFVDGNPAVSFNPAALSVSTHNVLYVYVDPVHLCTDSVTKNVRIDKPTLAFSGINTSYCKNSQAVTLAATPAGGSFTINGNAATQIDPTLLDTGFYTVVYSYTNPATGCRNSVSASIYIAPLPLPEFVGLDSVFCITSDLVALKAEPSGGAFTVNNLPVQMLDVSVLDVTQTHTVAYQYVEQNYGCQGTVEKNIRIATPPSVSISGMQGSYCLSDSAFTPAGNPAGGKFILNHTDTLDRIEPKMLIAGDHTLTYYFPPVNGCGSSVDRGFRILPAVSGYVQPDSLNICEGEPVTLTFIGTTGITWNTGQTAASISITPVVSAHYWVKGTDCVGFYDSAYVAVRPKPSADFTLAFPGTLVPVQVTATASHSNPYGLTWIIDSSEMVRNVNPLEHGFIKGGRHLIMLIADSVGCRDTASHHIDLEEKAVPVELPNVFTPNKDGINDDFGINPEAQRFVSRCQFQVFNRWGNLLFETADPYARWDGTQNGLDAPQGVYYYLFSATLTDQVTYKLTGAVHLVR